MHVLAIYQVNEHLAELMAEANAERLARATRPERRSSLRRIVASLFALRRTATPVAGAI